MDWTRGPIIGRGSTATVSLATVASSGEIIAVKSTELSGSTFLQREQLMLSKLNCCYIVKYLDCNLTREEDNKYVYNLCMEYVPGGTLRDEIRRHGGRLEEKMIRFYTNQIVRGVNYMHVNGLVHCDLKSENVLIGKDGAKIADLGCAKFAVEGGFATSEFSGTPVFMAPEVARREEQGFAADVWAVGCTVIEMATGRSPWPELSHPVSALYQIGFSSETPEIPGWLSEEGKDFLDKCLRRDPEERWTAQELLEHPFLSDLQVFDFEKVKNHIANSPCTVLDHGIWDSLEVLETPESLRHEVSYSNSPVKRIQQLIGSCSSTCSYPSVPSWGLDEDWITVRSSGIEETGLENETVSDLIYDQEELQASVFDDNLMLEFNVENVNTSGSSTTSNVVSFSRDDFVSENLNFETNNDNPCSIQSQLQLQCKIVSPIQSFWFIVCRKST